MYLCPSFVPALLSLVLLLCSQAAMTNAAYIRSSSNATRSTRRLSTTSYTADLDILADFKNRNLLSDSFSKTPMQWSADVPELAFGGSARPISWGALEPLPSVFSDKAQYFLDGHPQDALPDNALYASATDENVWVLQGSNTMAIRTDPDTGKTSVLLPMEQDLNVFTEVTTGDMDMDKLSRFHFDQEESPSGQTRSLQEVLQEQSRMFDKSAQPSPCLDLKIIEVAIAYESRFCETMGGAKRSNEVVQLTVARASRRFERSSLCTKLQLKHLEGYCNPKKDPYHNMFSGSVCKQGDDKAILKLFRNYWVKNRDHVHRDIAHLFHGFNHASGTVGCAWQGSLCNTMYGYGVNELTFGGNNNPHFWSVLFSHELGHSMGAPHEPPQSESLMDPIMCWECDEFSDTSLAYMRLHISGVGSCIATQSGLDGLVSNDDPEDGNDSIIVDTTTDNNNNDNSWGNDKCGERLSYCNLQSCCQPWICYNRFICL